jgi:hypothetical protein
MPETGNDRAHAEMASVTSMPLDFHTPQGQINIIMDNNEVISQPQISLHQRCHSWPADIHIGLRLYK